MADHQTNNGFSGSLGASDSTPFILLGGSYFLAALASSWSSGSVDLQALDSDGSTYVSCLGSNAFKANGIQALNLGAGEYLFAVSGASGVYVSISPIRQAP